MHEGNKYAFSRSHILKDLFDEFICKFFFFFSGASHSALGDMKTITQESKGVITSTEVHSAETDTFFTLDEFYSVIYANSKPSSRSEEIVVVAEPEPPKRLGPFTRNAIAKSDAPKASSTIEGEAQKKFGSAKAISSEQYFQDSASDNAVSTNYKHNFLEKKYLRCLCQIKITFYWGRIYFLVIIFSIFRF